MLAHHAKAAGDAAVCVRFSIEASRNALEANAPEEVLRVVDVALPSAATPQERAGAAGGARPRPRHAPPAERSPRGPRGARARSRRRSATRTSSSTSASAARRRCGRRGVRSGGELAREVRGGRSQGAATPRRSSPRAWSWARTCCACDRGRGLRPADPRGRPRRRGGGLPRGRRARARELGDDATLARGPPGSRRRPARAGSGRGSSSSSRSAPTSRSRSAWRPARSIEDIMPELPIAPLAYEAPASSAGARDLRAARRPAGRDGVDHRDGLPELGGRHPPGLGLGPPHRGDPPADVEGEGVHERERARGVRGADALRRPRVRPREG